MTRDNFIKMIDLAEDLIKESERWDSFGIEIFEMPIYTIPWGIFDCWAKDSFDFTGVDWINWYLWERKSINTDEVLACYDEEGKEFYVNTASDLWELVKDCRHKPCLDSSCSFSECNK